MSARPSAEDLKDQTGPVDDLCLPAPLEVALLYRAQRSVDDDETDVGLADQPAEILDGATTQQAVRPRACKVGNLGSDNVEPNGPGKADCLLQPCFN